MSTRNVNQRFRLTPRSELASEISAFLIDRQARGSSPRTIAWYTEELGIWRRHLDLQGVQDVLDVTPDILRRFLLYLTETGHNPGGVRTIYIAAQAFLRWYEAECEPQDWQNPIHRVQSPRVPEEPLAPVNLQDLDKMLATCARHAFTGDRDRALLMFLLDTGVRRSELCALDMGDVNLQTGAVLVRRGKGGKVRTVFMGAKTRRAMTAFLRHRPHAKDDEPLFCTDEYGRTSHNGLREMVRRRAVRANVPEPSLHSFRRGFALNMLRAGCDLVSLQRLLGHADLSVIQRYLCQVEDDLRAAHTKSSPVDCLLAR